MDKTVATVLKGFMSLSTARRTEFIEELNKYISGKTTDEPLKKSIRESTNTIIFGPAPSGCPCCGK